LGFKIMWFLPKNHSSKTITGKLGKIAVPRIYFK